jgi:hypothetical protein
MAKVTQNAKNLNQERMPRIVDYSEHFSPIMIVFASSLSFSTIYPLIIPFTALFYFASYIVYKYRMLFVYDQTYQSGNLFFYFGLSKIFSGIYIHHLFMFLLFISYQEYFAPGIVIFSFAITLWSHANILEVLQKRIDSEKIKRLHNIESNKSFLSMEALSYEKEPLIERKHTYLRPFFILKEKKFSGSNSKLNRLNSLDVQDISQKSYFT